MTDTDVIRWQAHIWYRHNHGKVEKVINLHELVDLDPIVEKGPHWDTICFILVKRVNHNESTTLTVEQAAEL